MYGINDSDLYDSVKDGTWTIDKMFEFASAIPENPQGTGTYRYIEPGGRSFLYAAGYTITKFDENGIRIINQVIGVAVIIGSVIMLLGTVTNLYRF